MLPAITPETPLEPPAPLTPKENMPEPAQSGAAHVDLGKILLPKKEVPGHTPQSAQRINAAVLLEQEVAASVEGTKAQQTPAEKIAEKAAAKPATPAPAAVSDDAVPQLETFQRDIERVVQDNKVSVLSIATAEADRRASGAPAMDDTDAAEKRSTLLRNSAMIAAGVIFLVAASGALAYFVHKTTPLPHTTTVEPNAPFISVDDVKDITITNDESREQILASLAAAKQATSLSIGLMSQLLVTESTTSANGDALRALSAQEFFTKVAPHMPQDLARNLKPPYLLGVHVYNDNQAFIVASVYSYEQGYSGMLAWEENLKSDLAPLFNYTPRAHIPEEKVATSTPPTDSQLIKTGFIDKVVENNDARVLINDSGDIYLLWTFLDRNTLVITTNDATLREVIRRLKDAPIIPVPGQ